MSITVCICANTLAFPQGGGHRWVYLNWALGLRALGCQVIWLEPVKPSTPIQTLQQHVSTLKSHLDRYNLAESVALSTQTGEPLPRTLLVNTLDLESACEADFLLNIANGRISPGVVDRFRRSAFVDIDPGLTQIWISEGQISVARHDVYFTIGETVGNPSALFPDCDMRWQYTPPPVFLPAWPPTRANSMAPYSTITSWWEEWVEFGGQSYVNGKRDGFLPFLDLPKQTIVPMELAISGAADENDLTMLKERGWRIRDAFDAAHTPLDYQHYIQNSRGEFSCTKPSYIRMQTAWISDRTICYLASGKPALIQHTGPSRFLPDSDGIFRFHNLDEAVRAIEKIEGDYERQCRLARQLAEEYFDSKKVVKQVLEKAIL